MVMLLEQHYLGCLSQASYFIADPDAGVAAVVDPRRDVELYLERAAELGVEIRHVLLTHFHADFLAGHLELARRTGATIRLGAAARADYAFEPFREGEPIDLGDVRLEVLETPGHTPESISILAFDRAADPARPHAVLTGDTLFVGDVGRPDLMASSGFAAEELAGMLYDSLHGKLLRLPDETLLYPGHGAGSACGKSMSSETACTIGRQRRTNYALQPMSKEEFVALVTAGQPPAPAYFPRAATKNRSLHAPLDEELERLHALSLAQVLAEKSKGAQVVDVRSKDEFAREHLAGSISIGLDGRYASWAGTLLDLDAPIVLVAAPGMEKEAALRLGRIGLDRVVGYLDGGPAAWRDQPDLTGSVARVDVAGAARELAGAGAPLVLDVRTSAEHVGAHVAGSVAIPLAELDRRVDEVPRDRRVLVHCKSGYRSMTAASLLQRRGHARVVDVAGGLDAWLAAGLPVVRRERAES